MPDTSSANATDFAFIRSRITAICYQVRDIAYDRMFAGETVQGLRGPGMFMVEFGQGYYSMAAPAAEFELPVKAGTLLHADFPCWHGRPERVLVKGMTPEISSPAGKRAGRRSTALCPASCARGAAWLRGKAPWCQQCGVSWLSPNSLKIPH